MSLSRIPYAVRGKSVFWERFPGKIYKAIVGFITAGGGLLCLVDVLLFLGLNIPLFSIPFLIFAVISTVAGMVWAIKVIRDDQAKVRIEENKQRVCDDYQKERNEKIAALISALEKLKAECAKTSQAHARHISYQIAQLQNNYLSVARSNLCIEAVNGTLNEFSQEIRGEAPLVNPENAEDERIEKPSLIMKVMWAAWRGLKVITNRFMSFSAGASAALGIAGSIIGVASISTLFLTPLGITIFAAVCVGAILVGVASAFIDYVISRRQDEAISQLEEEEKNFQLGNLTIDHLIQKVDSLKSYVSLKAEKNHQLAEQSRIIHQQKEELSLMARENNELKIMRNLSVAPAAVLFKSESPSPNLNSAAPDNKNNYGLTA